MPTGRPRTGSLARRERLFAYALLAPAVVAVFALIAYPMYLIFSMSFREGKSLNFLAMNTRPFGLGNYETVLTDSATWHSVWVSFAYTFGTIIPAFLLGLGTAVLLNRVFPLRRWLRSLVLLPWAVPGVMVSIVFLWLFDASFGVTNYFLRSLGLITTDIAWYSNESTALVAVIVPTIWKSYPFFTLTLLAAMQSIPGNLYEAAEVDGASAWQRFREITWPGIRGQATLALVLNGLWAFREFDIIYAATGGGPSKATETLGIRAYNEAFGYFYMGRAAVIGVLMLAIALVAVVLARKQLRKELLMRKTRWPILWTVAVALLCVVLLFPFYWMFVTAVLPTSQVLAREPALVPALADMSLRAFVTAFERKPLATWLGNSLVVMLGATAISLVISALAGYSLSRFRTRAQELTGLTLLLTKMLPGSLIVIPFFIMATTFHLIDSLWALMLANAAVGVPFATWLLKGFFDGIPRDLEHAAMIDGCGHLTAFAYVIIPLARPGLAACAIYLAILSWSDFVFAKTLINDQARWTITTGMVSFIGEHGIEWSALMAAGIISMVPMIVLFLVLEPFLVSGMTAGSQR